jgi:uncharacterized protein YndB with AHSA1/START domain
MVLLEQLNPDDMTRVVFRAEFGLPSPSLFDYFVLPELLSRWWSPEAECDGRIDGHYHLAWASMNWHLRGTYLEFERGKRLVYTWHWDHDIDKPARTVALDFTPLNDGTQLDLLHHAYTSADQPERQEHIDGWLFFLPKLQAVTTVI